MLPERWHEIERLYHFARELQPEERPAYLESACGGDDSLRGEVESLLAHEDGAARFLETDEPAVRGNAASGSVREGEQIGHYLVLVFLRKGGMGEVYKARDTRLDRTVAIKFLPQACAADPMALDRFQREARAASALNHPRICTVHDVGDYQGRPFFVMEFLEGQSLRDRIGGKPLPIPEQVDIAAQICDALKAAHAKGIIHRDIKPANIFITTGGQDKNLDFGLAKVLTQPHPPSAQLMMAETGTPVTSATTTRPGSLMGTLAYISPEQARGEEVDARTDVYSFGVVLYEMATGHPTFRRETSAELVDAILNEAPAKPSMLNAVPAAMERIILKALAKDREARYQSTDNLLTDLRRLQWDRSRRSRTAPLALLVVATVLVGAVVMGIMASKWPRGGVPDLVQRQVTTNPSDDSVHNAAISPDGRQLAYADLEGVHIRRLDTGETRNIPTSPGLCFR